ncbi:MAG TPA: hypothetical protein VMR06_07825 [Dokdonella sp.]|uniref:hypothetical protein n=1 Tax=Dokdonella sp. TaxID=2291710 RepID=UPI002C12ADA5|nr:hypothetical protein [Dokdonella sp.]HUD41896.1 hypothetical protein [Dokdonella sp.]
MRQQIRRLEHGGLAGTIAADELIPAGAQRDLQRLEPAQIDQSQFVQTHRHVRIAAYPASMKKARI